MRSGRKARLPAFTRFLCEMLVFSVLLTLTISYYLNLINIKLPCTNVYLFQPFYIDTFMKI